MAGFETLAKGALPVLPMRTGEILMNLTTAITGLQQAKTISAVQMRVARKVLDVQEFQGQAAVQLIEAAGRGAARAGDELVAAATGLGGSIDTYG